MFLIDMEYDFDSLAFKSILLETGSTEQDVQQVRHILWDHLERISLQKKTYTDSSFQTLSKGKLFFEKTNKHPPQNPVTNSIIYDPPL